MVGKRLMIVEDQRIVAEDLHRTLERLGYDVCAVVSSGEKALVAAEREHLDLAIMDVVLKGEMNGTEVAEELRERFGVPVVFLSAFADNATVEMAKRSAPLGVLVKPFNEKELMATLENALHRHSMEVSLKENEQKLRRAQKMEAIGTLAGGIAHDFNNVLSIILGNAELAEDDIPEGHPAREYMTEIKVAAFRARDMVRRLLGFARKSEAGREILSLQEVVRDAMGLLRSTLPSSIEICVDADPDACLVTADEGQMQQVMVNLCTNAAHAMPEGGDLNIRVKRTVLKEAVARGRDESGPGPYVVLSVCDSGVGMAPETLERIFDPYFTTREVGKGSGMGLSVVHGIVHSHGGGIQVRSRPGEGTEVAVLLPEVIEATEAGEDVDAVPVEKIRRVLLVDDEPSLVRITARMLERLGCQVCSFTDPLAAVGAFAEDTDGFDLVITDMTMPKMSGEQLARHVHGVRPELPVVLCTGYSERVQGREPEEMGVSTYAMKPLTRETMIQAMGRCLRRRGR